jgi:hypothetical protein
MFLRQQQQQQQVITEDWKLGFVRLDLLTWWCYCSIMQLKHQRGYTVWPQLNAPLILDDPLIRQVSIMRGIMIRSMQFMHSTYAVRYSIISRTRMTVASQNGLHSKLIPAQKGDFQKKSLLPRIEQPTLERPEHCT